MTKDWTRVADEPPKDGVEVLMYGKEWDDCVCHGWFLRGKWYDCEWENDPIEDGDITHWMPMPEKPDGD